MNVKEIIDSGKCEIAIKVDDLIKFTSISGCDAKADLLELGEKLGGNPKLLFLL